MIDLLDSSDDEESLSTDKDLENLIRKTGNMSISVPSDKENISNKENNKGKTKKTFEKQRESLTKELFSKFNRTVFDGKLESVNVVWQPRLRTTAGVTRLKRLQGTNAGSNQRIASIELATKILDCESRLASTLLHEMCHAAAWIIDGVSKPPHGSAFKKWASLGHSKVGIIVTTTHDYRITYKYQWNCTKCNFMVKRHSRSVDVIRQCCGKCKGKLVEVEIGKSGTNGFTPKKRKPASEYNHFVKTHSTILRAELTERSQGAPISQAQILKECARLWRERKAAQSRSETKSNLNT